MNTCPICHGEDGLLCRRCRAEAATAMDLRSADIAVHKAIVALELADTEISALKAQLREARSHLRHSAPSFSHRLWQPSEG